MTLELLTSTTTTQVPSLEEARDRFFGAMFDLFMEVCDYPQPYEVGQIMARDGAPAPLVDEAIDLVGRARYDFEARDEVARLFVMGLVDHMHEYDGEIALDAMTMGHLVHLDLEWDMDLARLVSLHGSADERRVFLLALSEHVNREAPVVLDGDGVTLETQPDRLAAWLVQPPEGIRLDGAIMRLRHAIRMIVASGDEGPTALMDLVMRTDSAALLRELVALPTVREPGTLSFLLAEGGGDTCSQAVVFAILCRAHGDPSLIASMGRHLVSYPPAMTLPRLAMLHGWACRVANDGMFMARQLATLAADIGAREHLVAAPLEMVPTTRSVGSEGMLVELVHDLAAAGEHIRVPASALVTRLEHTILGDAHPRILASKSWRASQGKLLALLAADEQTSDLVTTTIASISNTLEDTVLVGRPLAASGKERVGSLRVEAFLAVVRSFGRQAVRFDLPMHLSFHAYETIVRLSWIARGRFKSIRLPVLLAKDLETDPASGETGSLLIYSVMMRDNPDVELPSVVAEDDDTPLREGLLGTILRLASRVVVLR